jgi:2,4-dienoyl-CoA reductase-like NADH-dependent reductase (Old Yellow Enzyme family)
MQTTLFSPMKLRELTLKNRIVLAPMLTYAARRGAISDWHLVHLGKFAVGGVGLVFMESTKVDSRGCTTPNDAGLWKDEFIAPFQRLTAFIHQQGAAAGIQLGHSGRKARNSLPWNGRAPLAHAPGVDDDAPWEIIGPSAIAHSSHASTPREMTLADMQEQVRCWTDATRRAHLAGFDVLEIHAAHGYLLHQFLSPAANQRSDAYGGSLENRMRFPLEIVRAVRATWPENKPLFCRISATDESGGTLDDSLQFVHALKACGVDVIDCSGGGMSSKSIADPGPQPAYGYQVPYSAQIRREASIRTMAVGLIVHADQAEAILQNGDADLVALGRELLYNPHWALDAAAKLGLDTAYATVPACYGYWLEKRAKAGFSQCVSTWQAGIKTLP